MKAAILREQNAPLDVDHVELPSALDYGQVLVRVRASGICGAQIGEIDGAQGRDQHLPHLLGHEGSGVVEEVGPGVSHVEVGAHVVLHWRKSLGIEAPFPRYKWNGTEIGGGRVTTFNEYAVVSENRLTPIGKDIPFEIAALMGCAVTTGLGLVNNEACLKMGQSIAVIGCGGVGLSVIQGAQMVSAYPIIAADLHERKLAMARNLGATHTINFSNENFGFCLDEIMSMKGVDVMVDCTGNPTLINSGYVLTAFGGKMILVGQPRHDLDVTFSSMRQHYRGKILMDSQGGLTNPSEDIPRYLELYRYGKLRLEELITHHFVLDKVNTAIDVVREGQAGRCLLIML